MELNPKETGPLLAFVITTFNRAKHLDETLLTICDQVRSLRGISNGLVEVCVSDNGSSDGTSQVLQKYSNEYSFVRVFAQRENIGPFRNYYECACHARAEYLWIFGDDDYLLPGGLESVLRLIGSTNGTAIEALFTDFVQFDNTARVYLRPLGTPIPSGNVIYPRLGGVFSDLTFAGACFLSRVILRKKYWLDALRDVPARGWRVWPHVKAVLQAASEGPVMWHKETTVAQRVFHAGNKNWTGVATFSQAIEFPELAQEARRRGFSAESLKGAYSPSHAFRAYIKMRICRQIFGDAVIRRARAALKKEMPLLMAFDQPFTVLVQVVAYLGARERISRRLHSEMDKLHYYRMAIEVEMQQMAETEAANADRSGSA